MRGGGTGEARDTKLHGKEGDLKWHWYGVRGGRWGYSKKHMECRNELNGCKEKYKGEETG